MLYRENKYKETKIITWADYPIKRKTTLKTPIKRRIGNVFSSWDNDMCLKCRKAYQKDLSKVIEKLKTYNLERRQNSLIENEFKDMELTKSHDSINEFCMNNPTDKEYLEIKEKVEKDLYLKAKLQIETIIENIKNDLNENYVFDLEYAMENSHDRERLNESHEWYLEIVNGEFDINNYLKNWEYDEFRYINYLAFRLNEFHISLKYVRPKNRNELVRGWLC